jgi:hypothetical protein
VCPLPLGGINFAFILLYYTEGHGEITERHRDFFVLSFIAKKSLVSFAVKKLTARDARFIPPKREGFARNAMNDPCRVIH